MVTVLEQENACHEREWNNWGQMKTGKTGEKLGTDGTFTNLDSRNNWRTFRLSPVSPEKKNRHAGTLGASLVETRLAASPDFA
jgi:hypothetical protein